MSDPTETARPLGPVATQLESTIVQLRPIFLEQIKQKTRVDFEAQGIAWERFEAAGGFEAFFKTGPGAAVNVMVEQSCFAAVVTAYLEEEHRRRSEWESKIEARLNGSPVT